MTLTGRIVAEEQKSPSNGNLPRRWDFNVRAIIAPPSDHLDRMALDFGSSNTCAAYFERNSEQVQLVSLDNEVQDEGGVGWNIIPSAVFFHDLTDPQHPKISVGNAAFRDAGLPVSDRDIETPRLDHLDCLVRDAKRWIGKPNYGIWVFDPLGKSARYSPEDIVRFALHELIRQAVTRRSVGCIELSFPSKFTHRQLDAYQQIVHELEDEFRTEQIQVRFERLRLDEATAAALSLLYARVDTEQPGEKEDSFVLGTADWGGGTLDMSLMELRRLPDDTGRMEGTFRGFGGDARLGGNDVTGAFVEVLRTKLLKSVQTIARETGLEEQYELPLCWPTEGRDATSRDGLENYHLLWILAERLKVYLSIRESSRHGRAETTDTQGAKEPAFPRESFSACVSKLVLLLSRSSSSEVQRLPVHRLEHELAGKSSRPVLERLLEPLRAATLGDYYDALLPHTTGRVSVRQRLTEVMERFRRQVETSGGRLDYLLLAGAGSRLPILEELVRQQFNHTRIITNPELLKHRVAYGVAIHADYTAIEDDYFDGFPLPFHVVREQGEHADVAADLRLADPDIGDRHVHRSSPSPRQPGWGLTA
jgi:hypothetical protein